jgi:flagellar M-ring protein FliF
MIRSATATAPEHQQQALSPLNVNEEEEQEEEEELPVITLNRRSDQSGMSLRQELISMVREDPDAAASVLRTWIGDAA